MSHPKQPSFEATLLSSQKTLDDAHVSLLKAAALCAVLGNQGDNANPVEAADLQWFSVALGELIAEATEQVDQTQTAIMHAFNPATRTEAAGGAR